MLAFVIKRLLWAVMLVGLITLITFLIFFALPRNQPGSNRQGLVNPNLQTQYNLHGKSLPQQYVEFLRRIVRGDLGTSIRQTIPVREMIWQALPVTISLIVGGTIFWLLIAVPIGLISALRPRSLIDRASMVFVLIGVSAHPVWLGLMFSYWFGFRLHAFPVAGYCDLVYNPMSSNLCGGPRYWAYHMVLPWLTFALLFAALYARMIRASLIEAMDEDYVRTARGKGASNWRVIRKHVFRNAMLPIIAMLSMDLVTISFTGVVFIETVYQLPGLGSILYRALSANDLPVILGVVIVISIAVVVANLVADIVYCMVDPRMQLPGRRRAPRFARVRRPERLRPRVTESAT